MFFLCSFLFSINKKYLFILAESSQENVAVSPQPQRQTPPVQQSQIPQSNVYNGQSQGAMNQHNPYSGGQIPPPPPPQGFYCQL